jgi:hypothetical protein
MDAVALDRKRSRGYLIGALLLLLGSVAVCAVLTLSSAPKADAHYADFTGGDTQDWYIQKNHRQCLYNGSSEIFGCIAHSYSFISANDTANQAFVCAIIFNRYDHQYWDAHCATNFVRHCSPGQWHGGEQLNCHDQDFTANHAGASNGSAGTTVRMHGTW